MALSHFVPFFLVFGSLLGIITCMIAAVIAKPINLGLGLNALVGLCVGAVAGVTWLYTFDGYFALFVIGVPLACILVQTGIGFTLNARAR